MNLGTYTRKYVCKDRESRRAFYLFFKNLSKEQRYSLLKNNIIFVKGNITNKTYYIDCSYIYMVYNIRRNVKIFGFKLFTWTYCITSAWHNDLPKYDILLAQKLIIECDERKFLTTANKSYL